MTTRRLSLIILFLTLATSTAHAGVRSQWLRLSALRSGCGRLVRATRQIINPGRSSIYAQRPPVTGPRWVPTQFGWVSNMESHWGTTSLLLTADEFTIGVRSIAGDLYMHEDIVTRLRNEVGPLAFQHVRITDGGAGRKLIRDYNFVLFRRDVPDEEFDAKVVRLINLFLTQIPLEIQNRITANFTATMTNRRTPKPSDPPAPPTEERGTDPLAPE